MNIRNAQIVVFSNRSGSLLAAHRRLDSRWSVETFRGGRLYRRALLTEGDINRLVDLAEKRGYEVYMDDRLLFDYFK